MKIFGYLKKYWGAVLVILGFLIVQAHSDLSLPNLTSKIVDVGITQGGIETPTPEKVRASKMNMLLLFLNAKDKSTVLENYELKKGVYSLNLKNGMTKEKLGDNMSLEELWVWQSGKQKSNEK
ncbi:MAG: ABC transporter ATP-binding protein, partial [Streptococcaceae bacterium]|nr:ABC transporter ATP-binding protein [Streptococcaceae bacterium]